MTIATRSVAVVATHVPPIDRRALSQAWFSALHVAEPPLAPRPRTPRTPGERGGRAGRALAPAAAPVSRSGSAGISPAARSASAQVGREGAAAERRAIAGPLARRIERAVERQAMSAPLPRVASIAINAGDGRVQLLVRSDGATTRIVALCAPHLRERVDRALAHARFALAAAGNRIEVAG